MKPLTKPFDDTAERGFIPIRDLKRLIDYAAEAVRRDEKRKVGLYFQGGLFFATDGCSALWHDSRPSDPPVGATPWAIRDLGRLKAALSRSRNGSRNQWAEASGRLGFATADGLWIEIDAAVVAVVGVRCREFVDSLTPFQGLYAVQDPNALRAPLRAIVALGGNGWSPVTRLKVKAGRPLELTGECPSTGAQLTDYVGGVPQIGEAEGPVTLRVDAKRLDRLAREMGGHFVIGVSVADAAITPPWQRPILLQALTGPANLRGVLMPVRP